MWYIVANLQNGILLRNKKGHNVDICSNMTKSQKTHAVLKKRDAKEYILYGSSCRKSSVRSI